MEIFILTLVGLSFGSFVNALVWRLRKKRNFVSERSECTHCHHVLEWYDLIPVFSWLSLKGKCRYCKKKIDDSPLTELGVDLVFVLSYVFWPLGFGVYGVVLFIIWLIAVVLLAAALLYDLKWMLLPDKLIFPLIGLGVLWFIVRAFFLENWSPAESFLELAYGLASVAGLYGGLYLLSKGEWVGFGDVKLGIFMGLVLGWKLGLLAVMLANVFGFVTILPGLMSGKLTKKSRVPFGPFLIVATGIAFLFGSHIISWYLNLFLI